MLLELLFLGHTCALVDRQCTFLLDKCALGCAGGINAVTEDAASPSPGMTWTGILGALRQGNTPDAAASLDGSSESSTSPILTPLTGFHKTAASPIPK